MKYEITGTKNALLKGNRKESFNIIQIEENVKVENIDVKIKAEYWVPSSEKITADTMFLPFDDPDKNIKTAYDKFRKFANYLTPTEIRDARNRLELSLSDIAYILGINNETLSEIEDNKRLQTQLQENVLEYLKNVNSFYTLFKNRMPQIKENKNLNVEQITKKLKYLLTTTNENKL